jgi:hypothetical protein
VVKGGRSLVPTPLGRLLTAYLTLNFPGAHGFVTVSRVGAGS